MVLWKGVMLMPKVESISVEILKDGEGFQTRFGNGSENGWCSVGSTRDKCKGDLEIRHCNCLFCPAVDIWLHTLTWKMVKGRETPCACHRLPKRDKAAGGRGGIVLRCKTQNFPNGNILSESFANCYRKDHV